MNLWSLLMYPTDGHAHVFPDAKPLLSVPTFECLDLENDAKWCKSSKKDTHGLKQNLRNNIFYSRYRRADGIEGALRIHQVYSVCTCQGWFIRPADSSARALRFLYSLVRRRRRHKLAQTARPHDTWDASDWFLGPAVAHDERVLGRGVVFIHCI